MARKNKQLIQIRQAKNPYNYSTALFQHLTRLFSGPIVNYNRQVERTLRQKSISKYKSKFWSTSGQSFKRTQYNPFEYISINTMVSHQRAQRYADFSQMEFNPDLAAGLNVFADEISSHSHLEPILKIKCPNEEIKEILSVLYFDILNISHNLFGWARNMCKYGDFFLYLDIDEKEGIKSVIGLPSEEIERLEGEDPDNPNYVMFQWNAASMTFENWQVAHFRILGNDKFWPYGQSVLDPARRIWREMELLEQAMMSYRIVRSPERKVFYIDVGNIPPEEVEQYIQKVITQTKRDIIVDGDSGRADLRYSANSVENDFYLPVRGTTSGTRIESLPGGSYTGDIEDVKYLRDKLFSAIQIPMSYLSRGETGTEDKESLSQRNIIFARTIQRLQRYIVSELEKIGLIHLYINGFKGQDLLSFKLSLNNPSKIAELQELEHWRTKFDIASAATDGYFSRRWIAEKMFNMSDEEFRRNQRELFYDHLTDSELEKISSGEGETTGGEIGGGEDLGLGAEETSTTTEEEPEKGTLLAAPEEETTTGVVGEEKEPYLTPGAKGKLYYPVEDDKRDMGARKRSFQSQYSKEQTSNTKRNVLKGISETMSIIKELEKREKERDNYNKQVISGQNCNVVEKEINKGKKILSEIKQLIDIRGKQLYGVPNVVKEIKSEKEEYIVEIEEE